MLLQTTPPFLGRGQSGGGGGASTINTDYTVDELSPVWLSYEDYSAPVIVDNGTGSDFDLHIREHGNVIDEGVAGAQRYKLVYSGHDYPLGSYNEYSPVYIGYAYSSDGENWTKGGRLILGSSGGSPDYGRPSEDPYLVKHNGTYYLYVEDKPSSDYRAIRLYTSTDFSTWTDQGNILDRGTSGAWDDQDVSSPIVWLENGSWKMLFKGRKSGGAQGAISIATSPDGVTWTKDPSGPYFWGTDYGGGAQVSWAEDIGMGDLRIAANGDYVLIFHAYVPGGPWLAGVATGSDLTSLTDALGRPVRTDARLADDIHVMFGPMVSGVDFINGRRDDAGLRQGVDMGYEVLKVNFTGTNGSTSFSDDSLWGNALTANGNAQIQSNKLELDGTGDYVSIPDTNLWNLGSNDFTFELFGVEFDVVTALVGLINQWDNAALSTKAAWRLDYRGDLATDILRYLGRDNSNTLFYDDSAAWTPTIATAYDICLERSGSTGRYYVDGVMLNSFTITEAFKDAAQDLVIGSNISGGAVTPLDGRIAAVRITNGEALYADDGGYTVPSLPL